MKINISRHAKRRLKFYHISESIILKIMEEIKLNKGNQEIIENVEDFKYLLKIVLSVGNDMITVITAYPLKKGEKYESLL